MAINRVFSVLAAILFCGCALGSIPSDITITLHNDTELQFTYQPHNLTFEPQSVGGNDYVSLKFENGNFGGNSGDPQLPRRSVLIGLPLQGKIEVHVTEGPVHYFEEKRLIPISHFEEGRELSVEVYHEGEAYRSEENLPGKYWEVDAPETVGRQRVLRIFLYPLQFNPSTNRIEWCSQMAVRVLFHEPGRSAGKNQKPALNEAVYKNTLLNYESSPKSSIVVDA